MGGHEGYEEEDCQQDRHRQAGQEQRLQRRKGEDNRWPEEVGPRDQQKGQGREQEGKCSGEEEVRQQPPENLDRSRPEGQEGAWRERVRRYQEGLCTLQEGEGARQVSVFSTC